MAGDEVADAAGRAWRFDAPWDWHPFDGQEPSEPAWPLSLLTRDGQPDDAAATVVARATRSGSHEQELARWVELARPDPPALSSYGTRSGSRTADRRWFDVPLPRGVPPVRA